MFFTDNGADDMGDNIPPDVLNEVREPGAFYGFPYVQGRVRLKGFENAEPPRPPVPPVFEFQAHVATLGIHFYSRLDARGSAAMPWSPNTAAGTAPCRSAIRWFCCISKADARPRRAFRARRRTAGRRQGTRRRRAGSFPTIPEARSIA